MVIVKLSKKFWVGKIWNDLKRTILKGHVSSEIKLPRYPVTFLPFLGLFPVSTTSQKKKTVSSFYCLKDEAKKLQRRPSY